MLASRGSGVILHVFLTWTLDGGECKHRDPVRPCFTGAVPILGVALVSAKLGSGSQRFRAFKFDIYDSVYEHCELPAVEENVRE